MTRVVAIPRPRRFVSRAVSKLVSGKIQPHNVEFEQRI